MLIFRTNKYVTFQGKGDFAGMIKLWSLRWEITLVLLGGPNIITRVLIREGGNQESERERETSEDASLLALKMEEMAMPQGMQVTSRS